jgi:GNAT superfamily N-acetyltransferase
METVTIREAQYKDFEAIAVLCSQLGYQTESDDIPLRLKQIGDLSHHAVYLAELDQQVIGWIHVYLCPLLISPLQAQLGGLVVHSDHRGQEVGKKLMQQAEAWSRLQACRYLTVYTNITRTETHVFYIHLGYQNMKTEHVLRKEL